MNKPLNKFKNIMIYFICFAFIGWIYEVILFLVDDHILVNRGVLYGPWLPVYGCGGLIIYYLFYRFKNKPVKMKLINDKNYCNIKKNQKLMNKHPFVLNTVLQNNLCLLTLFYLILLHS